LKTTTVSGGGKRGNRVLPGKRKGKLQKRQKVNGDGVKDESEQEKGTLKTSRRKKKRVLMSEKKRKAPNFFTQD